MSEFNRLLDDDATDFERALLRSAAGDHGSHAARERSVRAAAAAALITAQSVGVAAAPSALAVSGLVKWGATGILLGTVFSSATQLLRPTPELPRHARSVASASPAPAMLETSPARPSAPPSPVVPSEPGLAAPAFVAAEPAAPQRAPRAERAPAPNSAPESSLAAELAILRETRSLLAASDGGSALRALDRYDTSFAQPKLRPEATLLRIEALLATGALGPARTLADRFLAAEPSGPHADRARSLRERAVGSE
jgi:hypothetical protein